MTPPITSFRGPHRFLSNFWECSVFFEGVWYPTVEHAYQAAKTTDIQMRLRIRELATPGDAKRAGKAVTLRTNWDVVKMGIMENLLRQKFIYNSFDITRMLKETGDAELIEGNVWGDTFWGVCNGVGENHLGKMIMSIRSEIFSQEDLIAY